MSSLASASRSNEASRPRASALASAAISLANVFGEFAVVRVLDERDFGVERGEHFLLVMVFGFVLAEQLADLLERRAGNVFVAETQQGRFARAGAALIWPAVEFL